MNLTLRVEYSNVYLQGEVNKLKANVASLLYEMRMESTLAELNRLVDNLCTLDQEYVIYQDLQLLMQECLKLKLIALLAYKNLQFLAELRNLWLNHCAKLQMLRNIYVHLEFGSTRKCPRKHSILHMGNDAFLAIIISNDHVHERFKYLFSIIDNDRQYQPMDGHLVKDLITMLRILNLYTSLFERNFLACTANYYRIQRDLLIYDVVPYFYFVEERMVAEANRVQKYFLPSTNPKLSVTLQQIFITERLPDLMSLLTCANIFTSQNLSHISTVYEEVADLPQANAAFCCIFGDYILNTGKGIVFDVKNEQNLVSSLLEFKDHVDDVIRLCLRQHPMYVESVRVNFKQFINLRKYKPAQLLAKYIDLRMRDKLIPEDLLDKVIVLFRYIQGKDVFEVYYKRYLAKRLILGKSSSQDAEKYMISKLKIECGDGFTAKMEGMFRDIDLSESLNQTFKQRQSTDAIEFSAIILTNSFWPKFCKFRARMSDHLMHYHNVFDDFYKHQYSGRNLEWIGSLDSCLLKARFQMGAKELQLSMFQALVLLLFNDVTIAPYGLIKERLELDDAELNRTLMSLVHARFKILVIVNCQDEGTATSISEKDEFAVNEGFSSKMYRIKINQLQYKDTEEEQKISRVEVMHDRQLQIDAGLVRLMKQNRAMTHNDLISSIYAKLKLPVNSNDIKIRIEMLIEREFLVRNPDDSNAYLYVA